MPPPKAFDPARIIEEENATTPGAIVRVLLEVHLPGGIHPVVEQKLTAFIAEGKSIGRARQDRVREAVHAILTMPEYQLC